MSLQLQVLSAGEIETFILELARLRIEVFREFPYLYQGSLEYEQRYLEKFLHLPQSTLVLVRDEGRVVGASTALPLSEAEAEFQEPFLRAGLDTGEWYYFGESVLERPYRGRGLGAEFFRQREARARALGYASTTFCAVVRPDDHPRRPADYRPLDSFWERQGYRKRPDLIAHFSWQDLDETQESLKPMVFWVKNFQR